jgi:hypothetical protein
MAQKTEHQAESCAVLSPSHAACSCAAARPRARRCHAREPRVHYPALLLSARLAAAALETRRRRWRGCAHGRRRVSRRCMPRSVPSPGARSFRRVGRTQAGMPDPHPRQSLVEHSRVATAVAGAVGGSSHRRYRQTRPKLRAIATLVRCAAIPCPYSHQDHGARWQQPTDSTRLR